MAELEAKSELLNLVKDLRKQVAKATSRADSMQNRLVRISEKLTANRKRKRP